MPAGRIHDNKCQEEGISKEICKFVQKIKDSTSASPWHRGDFHGVLKNWPHLLRGGIPQYRAALLHDRLDRLDSLRNKGIWDFTFLPERLKKRKPGKLLEEAFEILSR